MAAPIDFAGTEALNSLVTFFRTSSMTAFSNLHPHAIELLVSLAIIDLAITWSIYKGELRFQEMIEKIVKICFLFFLVNYMPEINRMIIRSFQMAGMIAAGQGNMDIGFTPASILNKGLEIIGAGTSDSDTNTLLGKLHTISIMSSGGIGDALLIIIAIICVCFSFFMMAVELMLTIIEFNIFASLAVILLPFGSIRFTSFLFQRCVSAVFQFGIKMLVIYFMLALVWVAVEGAKTISPNTFGEILSQMLVYLTLGFMVIKVPTLISGMMSGQPSMSGNGVANSIASAPMTALGAAGGAIAGAARVAGGTQAILAASRVQGVAGKEGLSMRALATNVGRVATAQFPVTKNVMRGADSMIENIRMGRAYRDGSYKTRTDESLKYGTLTDNQNPKN